MTAPDRGVSAQKSPCNAGAVHTWDWVDPLKDAKAEIEQIGAGLKSRTQALAERGFDAEQVDAEIAADKAREQRLGLTFGAKPSPLPGRDAPIQTGP